MAGRGHGTALDSLQKIDPRAPALVPARSDGNKKRSRHSRDEGEGEAGARPVLGSTANQHQHQYEPREQQQQQQHQQHQQHQHQQQQQQRKKVLITPNPVNNRQPPRISQGIGAVASENLYTIASMEVAQTPKHLLAPRRNIDLPVLNEPNLAAIYGILMYDHYNAREAQLKVKCYLERGRCQFTSHTRAKAVETMQLTCWRGGLLQSTLHLAVLICDRFLDAITSPDRLTQGVAQEWSGAVADEPGEGPLVAHDLVRVALASILVASKFEETIEPPYTPFIYQLLQLSRGSTVTKAELVLWERRIVFALKWELYSPTAHCFLLRYVRAGELTERETMIAGCLSDRCLLEYSLATRFDPSQLAAAYVSLARQVSSKPTWTATLSHYTAYEEKHILECKLAVQKVLRREEQTRGSLAAARVLPAVTPAATALVTPAPAVPYFSNTVRSWYSLRVYSSLVSTE